MTGNKKKKEEREYSAAETQLLLSSSEQPHAKCNLKGDLGLTSYPPSNTSQAVHYLSQGEEEGTTRRRRGVGLS